MYISVINIFANAKYEICTSNSWLVIQGLTAHEESGPIADSVINRSNRCEIARLARKALGNRRVLREEKLLPRGGQSNRLLIVANFRGQPSIEAHSCRMIHDVIESQQISLSDSLVVADKRRRLNIEIDFTSFCTLLVRRVKTFFRPIPISQVTQIGKDKPCPPPSDLCVRSRLLTFGQHLLCMVSINRAAKWQIYVEAAA